MKDFVYITDNAYTKDDILKMEAWIDSLPAVRHLEARLELWNCSPPRNVHGDARQRSCPP